MFLKNLHVIFLLFLRVLSTPLKATNYVRPERSSVEPDWDSFAEELPGEIERNLTPNLKQAIDYLVGNPPKKQVIKDNQVVWQPLQLPEDLTETERLVMYVRRVRNNLFHGGKFLEPENIDPERDRILVESSLAVLEACLMLNPNVRAAYES